MYMRFQYILRVVDAFYACSMNCIRCRLIFMHFSMNCLPDSCTGPGPGPGPGPGAGPGPQLWTADFKKKRVLEKTDMLYIRKDDVWLISTIFTVSMIPSRAECSPKCPSPYICTHPPLNCYSRTHVRGIKHLTMRIHNCITTYYPYYLNYPYDPVTPIIPIIPIIQACKWTQDDRNPDLGISLKIDILLHKWTP